MEKNREVLSFEIGYSCKLMKGKKIQDTLLFMSPTVSIHVHSCALLGSDA